MNSSSRSVAPIPAFLFSLPRSGSTLLQRMVATHPEIATGPEPTFLLPLLHMTSAHDVTATYDQRFTAWAIEDFFASADEDTFDAMVRAAAEVAYSRASAKGAHYFLDKTPKYHLIVSDLLRIFPESPAIVLWRNPLAVIASLLSTWGGGGGRWNLQHFRLDLFVGLPRLIDAVATHPDRFHIIRYEDLVVDPHESAAALFESLGLRADEATIGDFRSVELRGRVQDPNVTKEGFAAVRSDRVELWMSILSNPVRNAWCRRYLRWLGRERLAVMGYDLDDLIADLASIPPSVRFLASDLVLLPYDTAYRLLELRMVRVKLRELSAGRRPVLAHK